MRILKVRDLLATLTPIEKAEYINSDGNVVKVDKQDGRGWRQFALDTPLSETGESQAVKLLERLPDDSHIDHILFSDLRRTWRTGERSLGWTDVTYDDDRMSGTMLLGNNTVTWSKTPVSL